MLRSSEALQAWRLTAPGRVTLDGEEAREKGGRWHRPGRPLVYAASSCALATLEFLAHLDGTPDRLVALRIRIPADVSRETLEPDALPPDWRTPQHPQCCETGEAWLQKEHTARAAVLLVPSAVVPFEYNVLIDPAHPDAARVQIEQVYDYAIDQRVL